MAAEVQLAGQTCLLEKPRGAKALYVFAHGAGAGMRHEFMESVSTALATHQIATLRFDFPPARNKPEPSEAMVRTIYGAAAKRYKLPLFAGGKSFGARMTSRAHAAQPLPDLRGLVFFGWPLHPPDKPGIERAEHLPNAAGPMLFLTGDKDEFAQLDLLKPVIANLGPRAELQLFAGSDHGFTRPKAVIDKLATAAATWIYSH
ncbi:MAG: dienelactone hydrolase family protein [Kofleriaceae bacterium]